MIASLGCQPEPLEDVGPAVVARLVLQALLVLLLGGEPVILYPMTLAEPHIGIRVEGVRTNRPYELLRRLLKLASVV